MSIREAFPARKRRYSYAEKTPRSGCRTRSFLDRAVGRSPWNESMNNSIDGEPEITWDNNTPSPRRCTRLASKTRKRDAGSTNVSEIVRRITSTSSDVTSARPSTPTLLNVWMNKDDEKLGGGSSTRRMSSLSSMQTPIRRRNKRKVNGRPIGVRSSQVTKYMNRLIEEAEARELINNEDDNVFQEKATVGNATQESLSAKDGEVILAIDSEEEDGSSEKQKINNNDSVELFEKEEATEGVLSEDSKGTKREDNQSCKYEGGGENVNTDAQMTKLGKRKSNSPDPLSATDDLWDDDDLYCDDSFLRQATQIEIQCSQIADSMPVKMEDFSKNPNVVASTPLVYKTKSVIGAVKIATGSNSSQGSTRFCQKLKETETKLVKTRQFSGASVKVNQFAVKKDQHLTVAAKPMLQNPPRPTLQNTLKHTATRASDGASNPQSLSRRPFNAVSALNKIPSKSITTSVNNCVPQRTASTSTKTILPAKNFTVPSSQVNPASKLATQCSSKQFGRAYSPHKARQASSNPGNHLTRVTRNNSSNTLASTKSYPYEHNGKTNTLSKTNQLTTPANVVNKNDPVSCKNLRSGNDISKVNQMQANNSEYEISLTSDELVSLMGQDDSWDVEDTIADDTNKASVLKTNRPEPLHDKVDDAKFSPVSCNANTKMQHVPCSVQTNTLSGAKQIVHCVTGSRNQNMNTNASQYTAPVKNTENRMTASSATNASQYTAPVKNTENRMTASSATNASQYTAPVMSTGNLPVKTNFSNASQYSGASKLAANIQKVPTRMTLRSSNNGGGAGIAKNPTIPKDTLSLNKTSGMNAKPLGDSNKTLDLRGVGNNGRNASKSNQFMNARTNPVKSSGSSSTSESSSKLSSSQGEKACSQRYTPEEIERKKLEALKRRQERQQSSQSASQESTGRTSQCSSTQSRKYNFQRIKNGPK